VLTGSQDQRRLFRHGGEQVEQLIQSQWKQAGFDLSINNTQSGVLFGTWGPQGVFTIGMYAQVGTPDPGLCIIFCSNNIPSEQNGFVGQNPTVRCNTAGHPG